MKRPSISQLKSLNILRILFVEMITRIQGTRGRGDTGTRLENLQADELAAGEFAGREGRFTPARDYAAHGGIKNQSLRHLNFSGG